MLSGMLKVCNSNPYFYSVMTQIIYNKKILNNKLLMIPNKAIKTQSNNKVKVI